jgi:putative peptide zinc metalloprotease protein
LPTNINERMIMSLNTTPGSWRRRLGALAPIPALAVFILSAIPSSASAGTYPPYFPFGHYSYGPPGNVVVNDVKAVAHTSGQPVFNVKFQFHAGFDPITSAVNRAAALTKCAGCRAIAIAFQVVTTTEHNLAALHSLDVATANDTACAPQCRAVADAYQVVVATDTPSPLALDWIVDPDQRSSLSAIRSEFLALPNSGLTISQVQSRCEDLVRQVTAILRSGSGEAPSDTTFTRPFYPPAMHGVGMAAEPTPYGRPIVKVYRDIKLGPRTAD